MLQLSADTFLRHASSTCSKTLSEAQGNEIQLTDAIADLLKEQRVLSYNFEGRRFDCGSKMGYLKAQVEFALEHEEVGEEFHEYLQSLHKRGIDKVVKIAGAK